MGEEQKRKLQICEEVRQVLGWGLLLVLTQLPGSREDGNSAELQGLRSAHTATPPWGQANKAPNVGEGLPSH